MLDPFLKLEPSSFQAVDGNIVAGSQAFQTNTQEPSDAYLVARIVAGDEVGMALLYDRYARVVYGTALRYLRHAPAAEDVMQEVFLKIWRRPSVVPDVDCSLGSWLRRVAANHSIDLLRMKSSRCVTDSLDDVVLASPYDYKKIADNRLLVAQASACIDKLPAATRQIFRMVFEQDMTHLEVSVKTGCPLGTVKTRIRKGLLDVRKALTESQPAC